MDNMEFSDFLSPSVPIIHHSWQIFYTAYIVQTELIDVSLCWSANTGMSMCNSPSENVAYRFIFTSPAVPSMSGSSYFEWLVRWMVHNHTAAVLWDASLRICSKQHVTFLCIFYQAFYMCISFVQMVHPYSCIDTATVWEIPCLFLSEISDFPCDQ